MLAGLTALPVQVIDGSNLLSDRNTTENKKLKKVSFLLLPALVCVCVSKQIQPRRQEVINAHCM